MGIIMADLPLYVFIDESGDFNFSPSGTRFYTFTAIITHGPWEKIKEITEVKHKILSGEILPDLGEDYLQEFLCRQFHATEDKQPVRDIFFGIIQSMDFFLAHSIVVRKNRTNPSIQAPHRFYPQITGYLLDYVFKSYQYSKLCIFLAGMPVQKNRKEFVGAIKSEIRAKTPKKDFCVYFPSAQSNYFLQIADYINWAIYRKWENNDLRSYDLIKKFLRRKELDLFKRGVTEYYQFKK